MLRGLWAYRGFVLGTVQREFQVRYRSSLLGAAWTVLNPLAMIIVYTVVFSHVMGARFPALESTYSYGIYVCSGVLAWGLFAEITTRAQNVFLENANLLKKVNFPTLTLPLSAVATACLNFAIAFGLFTAFLILTGNFPGLDYLGIFPVLLVQIALAIGLGTCLGVLNVFFRDVGQLFGIVLQFWFWLTPIVYPLDALSGPARMLVNLNPMTGVISSYHDIFIHDRTPAWTQLLPAALAAVVVCLLALRLFRKHAGEMVDEL